MSHNPFAAPSSTADESAFARPGQEVIPVGKGLRFANLIIDSFVVFVLISLIRFMIDACLPLVARASVASNVEPALTTCVWLFTFPLYYVAMESGVGQTIAKFFTGTRVVDQHGNKPMLGAIVVRTLVRSIPFELFSFLTSSTSGWHDSLSKTFVVKSR